MSQSFIITNAGRQALVNASNTGTLPVLISHIGVTSSDFEATPAMTELPGEIKRLVTFGGAVVDDDTIHVTVNDTEAVTYTLRGFALYLANGVLFGLYDQSAPIGEKSPNSSLLLSADIVFADVEAATLSFGSTEFLNPPATTAVMGVIRLATSAETAAGVDDTRAVTPRALSDMLTAAFLAGRMGYTAADVLAKLITVDGAGSPVDAGLFAGQLPAYYTNIPARLGYTPLNVTAYTAADVLAKLITVDGAGSPVDAGLFAGQLPAFYRDLVNATGTLPLARLPYTPLNQASYTAADVLAKLITVDGAGSPVDAGLFAGQLPAYYTNIPARLGYTPLNVTAYTAADVLAKLITVDGAGSPVDAGLFAGQLPAYYTNIPARLGYTPVERGGGEGQGSNRVRIGWSGTRLKAQVDNTDLGNICFDSTFTLSRNANSGSYRMPNGMLRVWGYTGDVPNDTDVTVMLDTPLTVLCGFSATPAVAHARDNNFGSVIEPNMGGPCNSLRICRGYASGDGGAGKISWEAWGLA